MKKLLVAVIALSMTASAFAAGENMVRFYGWDGGDRTTSFDFSMESSDVEDSETSTTNIALNYARAFGQWQVGLTYKSYTGESSGTDVGVSTIGLSGYYNLKADIMNSNYVALHYNMTTASDGGEVDGVTLSEDDAMTTISLEYGQRWAIGSGWGMNLTYAPSVMYNMATYTPDADGADDVAYTSLAWNFLKFDVMF